MLDVSRTDIISSELMKFDQADRFIKLPIQSYMDLLGIEPNSSQKALINAINNPKYRFVCAALSRRQSKTYIANVIGQLVSLVPGSNILIMSPNYSLSQISFDLQRQLIKHFDLEVTKDNAKDKVIELSNGSTIRMGSVNQVDSTVGRSYDLIIFDEAHKSVAPEFSQVVEDFITGDDFNANLIGLTATPGRSYSADGLSDEDKLLADFYHNNKISMTVKGYISPIDYLVENGYLAKANFKPLSYDHSGIAAYELNDAGGQETMKVLSNNVERNKKIINTIVSECKLGSQIIVFACTVEHGMNLAVTLACLGIKAAAIDSKNDTPESRRVKIQQYKQNKLQVLVNFNVLTAVF